MKKLPVLALALSILASPCFAEDGWVSLFNGKDLQGWTPKFTGYPLGENFNNTFRAEDGVIKVSYDKWDGFKGEFGHLFYQTPYSNYVFKMEYRFTGDQVKGGPGWAFRNSGIMIHGQDPKTMTLKQDFPSSIEVQILGGNGKDERTTGNMCSPGTHIEKDGALIKQHCVNSTSKTFHGDQWVTIEIEVHGNKSIKHIINGETVMEYQKPQLDPGDKNSKPLIEAAGGDVMLKGGSISLQAESHPCEFRNIQIRPLQD
ncbi:MAG: DUF1080 domain-containing protein [Kiritimatiellia bacterium]